jgi:hypothetical protein
LWFQKWAKLTKNETKINQIIPVEPSIKPKITTSPTKKIDLVKKLTNETITAIINKEMVIIYKTTSIKS